MLRHILFMLALTVAAMAAGVAMVPSAREQWTMLVRDGRDEQALKILEQGYESGKNDPDAELHLYRLLMSFGEVNRATRVVERLVAERPDDALGVALLAKHYADTQNTRGEIGALKRLFELSPSLQTAHRLLALYRLDGEFDSEQDLLRTLYADNMIAAPDAERFGLLLASAGDLPGARDVLLRFDQLANPERMIGRLALFDILVRLGEKQIALAKAASWIPNWRKTGVHGDGSEIPAVRLVRMMLAVDEPDAREIVCAALQNETIADRRMRGSECQNQQSAADMSGIGR